jgi:tetratricopeptide (TPR) repeat protein
MGEHGSLATRQALALLASVRQPEAAAAELREVLAAQRRSAAPGSEQALTLETLGFIDSRAGRHPAALAQLREAVALSAGSERHGTTLMLLGDALQRAGDADGAAAHWQQALAAVAPQSVLASRVLCGIGYARLRSGDLRGARDAFERALAVQRRQLPAEHPYTAVTLVALGSLEIASGAPAAAQRHFEQALPMREHLYGRDSVEAVEPMVGLAEALARQQQNPQAIVVLRDALSRLQALAPEQQPTRAWVQLQLSAALRRQGEARAALALAEQALPIYVQAFGALHAKALDAHAHIEAARHALGDSATALANVDALLAQLGDRAGADPLRALRAQLLAAAPP